MPYVLPMCGESRLEHPPVVVGAGPAGLFGAYFLARAGFRPLLIERGDETDARDEQVRRFWSGGAPDPESNIQFGAGGAGAYSDGKLYTGVRDRGGRGEEILKILVEHGAPADILTEAHPHVGTDCLKDVVRSLIEAIRAHGGEVRFRTRLTGIRTDRNGALSQIITTNGEWETRVMMLAIGHSARDTMMMLSESGILMEPKAFAVGYRVAHPQEIIDRAQYGMASGGVLPPAIYKLTHQTEESRGVYSFCMCPGGKIVNASSEEGYLAVNGMSERARDGKYANSAIVVTVSPNDYRRSGHPLDGMYFQRDMERKAYEAGQGKIPIACYEDFRRMGQGEPAQSAMRRISRLPDPREIFCGEAVYTGLRDILPDAVNRAILSAMPEFGRKIRGFDDPETIFAAVESRTSSPVRMLRSEDGESVSLGGLYPCGEGAGYAGGIVSAAMDGMRTAEQIIRRFRPV